MRANLAPFCHELNAEGTNCHKFCPACAWFEDAMAVLAEPNYLRNERAKSRYVNFVHVGLCLLGLATLCGAVFVGLWVNLWK